MNQTNNNEQLKTEPICEEQKTVYGELDLQPPSYEEIGAELNIEKKEYDTLPTKTNKPERTFKNLISGFRSFFNGGKKTTNNDQTGSSSDEPKKNTKIKLNKNANIGRFTALGLSGTGKTCFMLGIYDKLMGGNMDTDDENESAFSLSLHDNDQLNDLKTKWSRLFSEKGYDRYPKGTEIIKLYQFSFNANLKEIQEFEWIDYKGGLVSDFSKQNSIRDTVLISDVLYIFVDGQLFVPENRIDTYEEYVKFCKNKVANQCSKQIFPFLHIFTEKNVEIPPIAIVVTKYDLIINSFNTYECINSIQDKQNIIITDEINKIIKNSFPVLFAPRITSSAGNKLVGIFPVSIGLNIADEGHSGEFKPCQIQAPIFFGICNILYQLRNVSNEKKKDKEEVFAELCNQIDNLSDIDRCYLDGKKISNIKEMITTFYSHSSRDNISFKEALNMPVSELFRKK